MSRQPHPQLVLVSVGNSRIKVGRSSAEDVEQAAAFLNAEAASAAERIADLASGGLPVIIASVNNPVADSLERRLAETLAGRVYRLGRDLQIPIALALDDATTVGQDRLLNALGAFSRARQACAVVDAGTAITVDFVDGEGTFQGGVIAPGARLMLRALHENTAALPRLELAVPEPARGPFGKDTAHAMLLGVVNAVRGMVRTTVEGYAEAYGAYPQVIATGGDAQMLLGDDPIVEHIVPDLQLIGLAAACGAALHSGGANADEDEEDA